jgi:hypothetical protein
LGQKIVLDVGDVHPAVARNFGLISSNHLTGERNPACVD